MTRSSSDRQVSKPAKRVSGFQTKKAKLRCVSPEVFEVREVEKLMDFSKKKVESSFLEDKDEFLGGGNSNIFYF